MCVDTYSPHLCTFVACRCFAGWHRHRFHFRRRRRCRCRPFDRRSLRRGATPGAVMPPCAASNPSLPASARRFPHNHLPSRCRPHRPPPALCSGVSSDLARHRCSIRTIAARPRAPTHTQCHPRHTRPAVALCVVWASKAMRVHSKGPTNGHRLQNISPPGLPPFNGGSLGGLLLR